MRTPRTVLPVALALSVLAFAPPRGGAALQAGGSLEVIGIGGQPIDRITDGDTIQLRMSFPQPVEGVTAVEFMLDDVAQAMATCTAPSGANSCDTDPFAAFGWYWRSGGVAAPERTVRAVVSGTSSLLGEATIAVAPRPVVMVHGFSSTWEAWANYLGPSGYLAQRGIRGFAVGDGQVPGTLNTGNLAEPTGTTNTIFENAAILGDYIAAVRQLTGAQTVDLLAHSMGGLISRAYIGRVMSTRDVGLLIMLGSPMAGSDCVNLPAALGLYLPATLEIRPGYVTEIFNPQVSLRRGVPFHMLAGVPIVEGFQSPCTDVPSDRLISLESATAIPLESAQMPVLHGDLNTSEQVFESYVLGRLQIPAGSWIEAADPPAATGGGGHNSQFSRVFTGHVAAGSTDEVIIPIDADIRVASFTLYDTTRSLQVQVTGASGNVIELSVERNGLVVVDEPGALFYLGYGFQDPRPGEWRVRLEATDSTPSAGAEYALTARFVGGAQMEAELDVLTPEAGQAVRLTARLRLAAEEIPIQEAEAAVRGPDGALEMIPMEIEGTQAAATLRPSLAGVYGLDVRIAGLAPDGSLIERTAFLALEAHPARGLPLGVWLGAGLGIVVLGAVGLYVWRRRGPRRR